VRTGHIGHVIYQGSSAGQFHNNVINNISNLFERHYREISAEINRQFIQYIRRFSGKLLFNIVKKISIYALNKILNQITLLTSTKKQNLVELFFYTNLFRTVIGLPYAHEIKRCKEVDESFSINKFHPY
jgi:hypothetical protein